MGIGLVLIVSNYYADAIRRILHDEQLACWQIGEVVAGSGQVSWK
jgi:phosphoribosylaminoimidazole (AIR) synthetase